MGNSASTVAGNGLETVAGRIVSIILSLVSMGALSVCFSRRVSNVRDWSKLPLVCWLILIIYIDSTAFVSGSAIISTAYGVNSSLEICKKAVLLCLGCYMTTKLMYYFLVERVFIIRRNTSGSRLKDKLYLFNAFGMLIPYCVVISLNFYFRFAYYENGTCRIGMKRVAMVPLIAFDILVNVYLTSLFLIPLRSLYSYKNNRNSQARTVALRTFTGSCATLVSSVANLTTVMILDGEPGWICLMCCNVDILFSVLVLHWITTKDNASTMVHPSQAVELRQSCTPPSPRRLTPRPPLTDFTSHDDGLRNYHRKSGITTRVTSVSQDETDDLALMRIHSILPNVVTVEMEYTREVLRMKETPKLEEPADGGVQPQYIGETKIGSSPGMGVEIERANSTDEMFRKE